MDWNIVGREENGRNYRVTEDSHMSEGTSSMNGNDGREDKKRKEGKLIENYLEVRKYREVEKIS